MVVRGVTRAGPTIQTGRRRLVTQTSLLLAPRASEHSRAVATERPIVVIQTEALVMTGLGVTQRGLALLNVSRVNRLTNHLHPPPADLELGDAAPELAQLSRPSCWLVESSVETSEIERSLDVQPPRMSRGLAPHLHTIHHQPALPQPPGHQHRVEHGPLHLLLAADDGRAGAGVEPEHESPVLQRQGSEVSVSSFTLRGVQQQTVIEIICL